MGARMSSRKVGVILVALVSLVWAIGLGFAADWPSVLKEAKAKYAAYEKQVKDMTVLQELKMNTAEGEMTSQAKLLVKGPKFRMDTMTRLPNMPKEMGPMQTIVIYDGKDTWMISPFQGNKKLSPEEARQYQAQRNWWSLISEDAKIVGAEKVGDRECHVVEIAQKDYPFTKIWLDKDNLVLVKGESKGPKGETFLWVQSDFRKIEGGWEIPYQSQVYADGKLLVTATVKSIEINKGLADDLFDPTQVKATGINMQELIRKLMEQKEKEDKQQ